MSELRIMGSAGHTFPALSNHEVLKMLGNPRTPAWVEERIGILGHSLNLDPETEKKRIPNQHAVDYAEIVAMRALEDAGIPAREIDQIVYCTCTPAQPRFHADAIDLHHRLGLRRDAVVNQIDGGCAALAQAFQLSEVFAREKQDWTTLIVASNDVISYLDLEQYRRVPQAWISFMMFADGAGALVMGAGGTGPRLAGTHCAYDGKHPLVTYRGGGGIVPTRAGSLDEHTYLMDARDVAVQFGPALGRVWSEFSQRFGLGTQSVQRWYFHQANLRLIQRFAREYGIPEERVPTNVDRFGNTVSASTLLLLDEDRKSGLNDAPFLFMWVGAGMVEGGALFLQS